MHDDLRLVPLEQLEEPVGTQVHVEERELRPIAPRFREVGDLTGGEVVHRQHTMALGQEPVRHMRADEAGSSGDEVGDHASSSAGSGATSNGDRSPRARRDAPATAIIAALSVHSSRDGNWTPIPASAPAFSIRSRSRVLATTPPPRSTAFTPCSLAAAMVFDTWTSTMASWKEAARSAVSTTIAAAREHGVKAD